MVHVNSVGQDDHEEQTFGPVAPPYRVKTDKGHQDGQRTPTQPPPDILEAKNRLSLLIKSALASEEVVIANRGDPVAPLVPIRAPGTATANPGNARAILDWLNRHPLPAYARRSAAEIDAALLLERSSWD